MRRTAWESCTGYSPLPHREVGQEIGRVTSECCGVRVLLSTIGSRGDVQPLVALALALRSLRQEVRLCVPPDFQEWIEGYGFPVTPLGPAVRQAAVAPRPAAAGPPSPDAVRQAIEGTVAVQFETIAAAAEGCDLMLGATALQVAAPSVAERRGIPYVFAAYSPAVLPSPHHAPPPIAPGQVPPAAADYTDAWARDAERWNGMWSDAINAQRTAGGLEPVDEVRRYVHTSHPWLAADPVLAPWPGPADSPVFQSGAWLLPDERPLPAEVEQFLAAGEPPIYFGFGSTRAPEEMAQVMLQAARRVGRRAILSQGWANLAPGGDHSDCLGIGEVNFRALFPRVAAVVHHGGAGTTTLAALAGVPQVVMPQIYDQFYWAQRVQDLGIGSAHPPGAARVDSLTSALEGALRPEARVRARALAPTVRTDGAEVAARRLVAAGARK